MEAIRELMLLLTEKSREQNVLKFCLSEAFQNICAFYDVVKIHRESHCSQWLCSDWLERSDNLTYGIITTATLRP